MANAHTFKIRWPIDDNEIEIRIELAYWERLLKYFPTRFRNIETALGVLHNPNRIFSGLNRPLRDSSNMLCFVGKPRYWFVGTSGSNVPFPTNLVYLVFLNERRSIFEFGAEFSDAEDPLNPENWRDRFGELLWQKI